ncbi:putative E3 ubiquitin-protein ligase ARI7 [Fusarium austroafricanum]|uniref:RBR-type E3 ubiquitin transferase n=1 Tax=Fusarium austroafricanum TaxID=2364996 RepID=A0A8H4NYD8_9HYPO|nr:putative E3 ubiquitin-protein ligase ARI7 [Fusarium austroafricanum]
MHEQIKISQCTISKLLDENKTLKTQLSPMLEESVSLRQRICSMNVEIQALLNEKRKMAEEVEKLLAQIVKPPLQMLASTRRGIIISKLLSRSESVGKKSDAMQSAESLDSQADSVDSSMKGLLDSVLSADQARILFNSFQEWFDEKNLDSISLRRCAVCHKIKFEQATRKGSTDLVDEFSTSFRRPTTCSTPVCSVCYSKSISDSIQGLIDGWWELLGPAAQLSCPCGRCSANVAFQNRRTLLRILRLTEGPQALGKVTIYAKAQHLMSTVNSLEPQPTLEARQVAKRLHQHLISKGTMKSPFDLTFLELCTLEKGQIEDINFKLGQLLEIDGANMTLRIPIFTRLLQLEPSLVECSICTESIRDVVNGTLNQWNDTCSGYSGDWQWKVLPFPHAQLDQHGRAGCHILSCPSLECSRRLEYDEVKLYARQDTFLKYDEYLKLDALSKLPSFRWCLAEKCSYGQIHDLIESNHVSCEECGYEMCFEHQVKWHDNFTCEEFDSMQENGDPRFQETRDWVDANTKQCPSCRINTQKGPGCFHMTCTLCRHEFCWECLASWSDILPMSGEYNQSAHKDGCYFRSSNQQPTQIVGESVPTR